MSHGFASSVWSSDRAVWLAGCGLAFDGEQPRDPVRTEVIGFAAKVADDFLRVAAHDEFLELRTVEEGEGAQRALGAFASALLLDLGLVDAATVAKWHPRTINSREGDPVGEMRVVL